MTLGTLVRYPHPARRVVGPSHVMNDLLSGFGLAPLAAPLGSAPKRFTPRFDAVELENEYRVTAELPGVEPSDLDVTVEDGVLKISGQRRFDSVDDEDAAGENSEARFERSIRFPAEVAESDAKATYKNGLLTVSVPKPEEVKPEVRSIPVETA